jgi:hypothetical protein
MVGAPLRGSGWAAHKSAGCAGTSTLADIGGTVTASDLTMARQGVAATALAIPTFHPDRMMTRYSRQIIV